MPDRCPWSLRQRVVKRGLDLAVALPILVITSPLIALCGLLARVDTRQSAIFAQERVGRHGQLFTLYKIRTMRSGGSSTVTTRDDIRITTLGGWLRISKLDELPQLINVLRGDMSLVGPRPDVPGFADLLVGEQRIVLSVPPGITGPASLHYRDEELLLSSVGDPVSYNHEVLYPDKVRINIDYVHTQSVLLDMRYLVNTLFPSTRRVDIGQREAY